MVFYRSYKNFTLLVLSNMLNTQNRKNFYTLYEIVRTSTLFIFFQKCNTNVPHPVTRNNEMHVLCVF